MADKSTAALERLARLAQERRDLQTEIDGLVALVRSPDLDGYAAVTLQAVADALGVTRQAVQKRYRHLSWGGVDNVKRVGTRGSVNRG